MLFLREIKVLEARQRLEALVIPKRQALTRLQGLLAPLLHVAEMTFPQQIKTSVCNDVGYRLKWSAIPKAKIAQHQRPATSASNTH
jgi:hypothetical protein